MKIALCTTTINVPHVLKLYRACDPDVKFFVALDEKRADIAMFPTLDPSEWLMPSDQKKWKCSEPIGWGSIQRRNIAFLEALKWGADIIVSVDDDNIPLGQRYFDHMRTTFCWGDKFDMQANIDRSSGMAMPYDTPRDFSGVMSNNINQDDDWFDVGSLLRPQAKHRGFPHQRKPGNKFTHVVGAKVGVAAGICLGDPDIDATTRIAVAPEVHQVSQLLESGIVVNPHTWTVFNSQNTAIRREFIPAWFMWPGVFRMDDIYASLLVQRVMRERGYHVHFGKPYVYQQRNSHDLIKDLRGEIDGYNNVERLADILDHMQLVGKSVVEDCRRIWDTLSHADWVSGRTVEAAQAWLDDCEAAL